MKSVDDEADYQNCEIKETFLLISYVFCYSNGKLIITSFHIKQPFKIGALNLAHW